MQIDGNMNYYYFD